MTAKGAKRPGRKIGKHWLCWRSRSQSVKSERRSIERSERQAGKKEERETE